MGEVDRSVVPTTVVPLISTLVSVLTLASTLANTELSRFSVWSFVQPSTLIIGPSVFLS